VLVLATVWPGFWDALTGRPADGEDRHAQARELLAGHDITVPAAFTPVQMSQLARAADVRMVLAARSAPDGEVIQFLAGAPELLARYRNAPSAAAALIDAAMDARRLGIGAGLPQAFLEAAAPGYLTDDQWDGLGEDWLEQALAYTAVPCKGARGPLTRIRPGPPGPARQPRDHAGAPGGPAGAADGPGYRLADWLDQHGRARRAGLIPPTRFWAAAAACAAPGDQAALGDAAAARGLYRAAAQLHKNATAGGAPRAAEWLARPHGCLGADPRPAHWAAAHAPLDNPSGVADLLDTLRAAGADEQAAVLAARAAAHAALDNPGGVADLLERLRKAGADEQAAVLLARDPAAHAALDNPGGVAVLLGSLRAAGADEQAAALLARDPAAHAALDNPGGVAFLLEWPASHTGTGWVLATTRRRDPVLSGGGRHVIGIDVYEEDEATTYLRQRLTTVGKAHLLDDRAAALAKALGWLPLALSHAAAYMIGQRVTCGAYLDLYTAGAGKLDELMPDDPDGHTRSIAVTLLLALDAADAQATAGLARPAMDLAPVLDPAGCPEALWATGAASAYLTAYRTRTTSEEAGSRAEPVTPRQARAALLQLDRYGLITLDEQAGHRAVRIHALTARAARETSPGRQAAAVRAAADAVLALWPDAHHDQPGLTSVLRANTTTLATHAAHAGDALWTPDGGHPLLEQAGLSLLHAGLHNPAITHWKHTAGTAQRILGPEHPDTLTAQANLASSYRQAGRTAEAITILEKVTAAAARILGPEHPDTQAAAEALREWKSQ
jgi:Tetratricopeptide repeat